MRQDQKEWDVFQTSLPDVDRDRAKQEMGAWIADYLDDAGYANWESQCQLYKSMFMSAFPPIVPLDGCKPDNKEMPLEEYEAQLAALLGVMDTHLATEERVLKPQFSIRGLTTLIKRR